MKQRVSSRLLALVLACAMLFSIAGNITMQVSATAPASYTNITAGQTKTVTISTSGSSVYFRFVPEYTGTYAFQSSDINDPLGSLLNSEKKEYEHDKKNVCHFTCLAYGYQHSRRRIGYGYICYTAG